MNTYFGDLHNHCGITYGFGSLKNALAAARGQLDFCAVIGHAMWPDMPERTEDTEFLIDFHKRGFDKLEKSWDYVRSTVSDANRPDEFVTFQGYEIHSAQYGDYHIISMSDNLPLIKAVSPGGLAEKLVQYNVIAVPHHTAYTPGYRGINWETFSEKISPVVEVYSKHGCGMSDESLYPYYHTMGPRDSRSTIFKGLQSGHRFGFIASTDHHAGYPGSYGDGRVAVMASEKTREAIWEALINRRVYAVTGDKIVCDFRVNGAMTGSEVHDEKERKIFLNVKGCHFFDQILLYKNLRPWKVISQEYFISRRMRNDKSSSTFKVRLEMGWGNNNEGYSWNGSIRVSDGEIIGVEPCFRGKSVLSPTREMTENPDINKLDNTIICKELQKVQWRCVTFKNPSTLHPATASIILELKGDSSTLLTVELNGVKKEVAIGQLLEGSISCHVKPYTSEAFLLHRAVPDLMYCFESEWVDTVKENPCDIYHVEIRQTNGQCAWISPVFVI